VDSFDQDECVGKWDKVKGQLVRPVLLFLFFLRTINLRSASREQRRRGSFRPTFISPFLECSTSDPT
jgi:hypothetical protein